MQNRAAKQFEGFLKTPPLWTNSFLKIDQFLLPEIEEPLKQPITEDLPSLASNFVMGKRVERFFEWIIRKNLNYKLLAENMQISRNKITLGELDFLLEDLITRQVFHIEMVYKFYVYDPSFSTEMKRWIGPNRRDTLLQKTEKLREKQFPLLYKPDTKDLLNSLGLKAEEILQQTCFKASLFVPKHLQDKQFQEINNDCVAGIWLHLKDFISAEYRDFQFYAPRKQDWPMLPEHGENWVNHSDIITKIENSFQRKKAPLIWVKKPGHKFERLFVVWW
ncbi:hypothetical protein APR41_09890 [Salegentibacter salinarum]|uniref:DUF1853 domain-containing protein n=1 Tax=Salegentibacter salinarum TaxID=447422 RepID=A0A2N0TMY1_9FLAO|nr:DUF1853 family protein [Salegentibacter salinarum]PKD16095.1 hypothetical protein APR41_09890 [Salegentibacter salinarum]SKB69387.1 hypothetical protein SAMN05660903_02128 [Salegentibacter salinarum]